MLIDLHTHTRPLSHDSLLTPDDLIEAAKAAGLDAVCLTEHDFTWDPEAGAAAPPPPPPRQAHARGALTGRGPERENAFARGLCERFGLRAVPASDAHQRDDI